MSSVTVRISQIKQPRGGYIKPSMFVETTFTDGNLLFEEENIHATLIGMAVDYLTRYMSGTDLEEAFKISLIGAQRATLLGNKRAPKEAENLLKGISGLDDNSVINACKLVTFDVWLRNPMGAMLAKDYTKINPDSQTKSNIRIMVERGINFWKQDGPVIVDGFTFEPKGYTVVIDSGDGDYLTADTMWDFKVSKS